MTNQASERLNKHLALILGVSRREADLLIEQGKVAINDAPARLGARFSPSDRITVKGKQLHAAPLYQYIMFHKPVGYVCSRKPQGATPTIYSLLPAALHRLKPVGRLDKDSSGLLLLTNDGDLAYTMTHPKFHKLKIYQVTLDQELAPLHQQMINDFGIQLDDGKSQLTLSRLTESDRLNWQITMHEGRNRQIRRTFAALGYTVTKLHRTQFGAYTLGGLPAGGYTTVKLAST